MKAWYNWACQQVHTPYASALLALLVVVEAVFIVPINTLLGFYCLQNKKQAFWYATIASCMSLVGGIIGYYLGAFFWHRYGHSCINFLMVPATFDWLSTTYKTHAFQGLFWASLLPIPYKLLTLTAGFCKVPLGSFLAGTGIARSIKFFIIAGVVQHFQEDIHTAIDHHFYLLVGLGIIAFIVGFVLFH
jgi:membrane protein YqaA with SNARE-associated domain